MSISSPADRLAGNWQFAAVHSSADFSVKYLVARFRGSFSEFDASLEDGTLSGSVKVGSVTVKEPNLIAHLQSPDFFDADRFPEITFKSTDLRIEGDVVKLEGDITLKGTPGQFVQRERLTGRPRISPATRGSGFTLETTINRAEFGVSWNADLPKGGKALSDDVVLSVELEFHQV